MKVLVVDDSKAMRKIVCRALGALDPYRDATILEAADGREALGMLEVEVPDLVLSDWNMPEMTGIELLETLNDRGRTVRFGFVTSESTPEMFDRASAAGAAFLVSKPFTPQSLGQALGL